MLPTLTSSIIDNDTNEGTRNKLAKQKTDLPLSYNIAFTKQGILRRVSRSNVPENNPIGKKERRL
jgi:hypothetical protein